MLAINGSFGEIINAFHDCMIKRIIKKPKRKNKTLKIIKIPFCLIKPCLNKKVLPKCTYFMHTHTHIHTYIHIYIYIYIYIERERERVCVCVY